MILFGPTQCLRRRIVLLCSLAGPFLSAAFPQCVFSRSLPAISFQLLQSLVQVPKLRLSVSPVGCCSTHHFVSLLRVVVTSQCVLMF